jgi:hypothetical protein
MTVPLFCHLKSAVKWSIESTDWWWSCRAREIRQNGTRFGAKD